METNLFATGTITFRNDHTFPDYFMVGSTRVDLRTGEVTLPEGADISTAAREFWAEVSKAVAEAAAR